MMQLDKEDKLNYVQRTFFEKKESIELNSLTIFFAVLAAILVSWLIRIAYIGWQLRQMAIQTIARTLSKMSAS